MHNKRRSCVTFLLCWSNPAAWQCAWETLRRGFAVGKRQGNGDQACSKDSLCYPHVLAVSQMSSQTSQGRKFCLGLEPHPRDKFASVVLADCSFIHRAELPFHLFLSPFFPRALYSRNSSSAYVYPTQSTCSHPGMITWKSA